MNEKLEHKIRAGTRMLYGGADDPALLEKASGQILARALASLPNQALPFNLPDLKIESAARIGDNLVAIRLREPRRVFYGQRSEKKQYLWHQLFKRVIPAEIDGDAFKLALDVQIRYFGGTLPWRFQKGAVLVEGGCYTGLKALRWHDHLQGDCKILAVEIGRENHALLSMNVRENGAENIRPVHAGLWREDGEMTQKHSFTTRRFLEKTDRWEKHMDNEETVRVLSLESLLNEQGVDVADYVNLQVNGAEIEVLKGVRDLNRIKVFGVAAYYGRDGCPNLEGVKQILQSWGCTVLSESDFGRIEFVTPKHRDEILDLQSETNP